jgi:pimeloyl-ACP methyl ester carboxylesterase
MREQVIQFGPAHGLVGIVTNPANPPEQQLPAVILLNAGLLHRVGPNRLYVQIARALAAQGHMVLRFDFSGIGDSRPRADHLPYNQSAPAEIREAMDWLSQHNGIQQFILIGHCAGAIFSLLVACEDTRVVGAALMNPEGGDDQWTEFDRISKVSQQQARIYGKRTLFSGERWLKLLSGRANYRSIARMVFKDILWYRVVQLSFRLRQRLKASNATVRAAQAAQAKLYLTPITDRGAALLLLHSEGSTGLRQIRTSFGADLERLLSAGKIQLSIIPQSDHLFLLVDRQRQVCTTLIDWVQKHIPPPQHVPTPTD